MGKTIAENEHTSFTVAYRAYCVEGDLNGNKYPDKQEAVAEAMAHHNANNTHKVGVEIIQKQTMKTLNLK